MSKIHWLGTGLSAIPGLKMLIENGHSVIVYNRTVEKAREALIGIEGDYRIVEFSLEALEQNAIAEDVVVSMLPGNFHVPVAELSLSIGAHFVSSSYISDEMKALHERSLKENLCLVNEVGLDPGIDHSMSHALVEDYKKSNVFSTENKHSFLSYCGGLSDVPNDFCYKFSWSPLGVLKALMSTSVSIRDSQIYTVHKPWEAVELYPLPMPWGEDEFEVYPNRDSIPFIEQYQMDNGLKIDQFVRGTLRYKGWKDAWSDIFSEVDTLDPEIAEDRLKAISEDLWNKYSYRDAEVDRVILTVELKVKNGSKVIWHKQFLLDTLGNTRGSAMAQLVSCSVALAVEAVLNKEIPKGVTAAPHQSKLVKRWLNQADEISDHFVLIDHLS
ncbi:saccharopine dehydrogenase C-terminal domain-containing protein [Candidatus Thioglobus sp. NP1]|uniref:saccharopine dehydrogenase C-terminal domain-containing protein n=1 Tax=Candidatus Thioglobus sp. NP1 TaxID=2508687 RepID=UPI000DED9D9B|nr:saccharopine dehydrogenase C-terminal domain-containing protein [Candidatus Thioglobus sp. NP1]AXE62386.1 saccharopine dehydrogenase [Candidatus Thioglobus sp. NP1]